MGTEVVVFLKAFFQDFCRLIGLPAEGGTRKYAALMFET